MNGWKMFIPTVGLCSVQNVQLRTDSKLKLKIQMMIKKPKGWFESSGCEIQRRVEKGFAGFVCFGSKKVKLYIIAKK